MVRRYAAESDANIDVLALPVSVAAFMTPEYVAGYLGKEKPRGYDMILTPGAMRGDVTPIEETTGVPTFKGPIHAADIPHSLGKDVQLSKVLPASDLAKEARRKRAEEEIQKSRRDALRLVGEHDGLVIGSGDKAIPVGAGAPMPVIAEIVNAPIRGADEIVRLSRYYEEEGANIIDIGMFASSPMPDRVPSLIEMVRGATSLPVSIDTLDSTEIASAATEGIDLVLSLDAGNMKVAARVLADTPVVILPSNMRRGNLASDPRKRVAHLLRNIKRARGLGLNKVIADPVLEPAISPGLMNSLTAYRLFREKDQTTPILFGLGNVTELMDVDSPGVNGLLAALAQEVGANLLFTPEFSDKARGSVRELATASMMMFLAERRGTPPKDLGMDLLLLKEKRKTEEPRAGHAGASVVEAAKDAEFHPDASGWFRIQIDRDAGLIEALFYRPGREEPEVMVRGAEATEVYQTIIRGGLIKSLDHAAYLGRELEKSEIALKLGRSYTQEEPLF